jgi:hypothetical protein
MEILVFRDRDGRGMGVSRQRNSRDGPKVHEAEKLFDSFRESEEPMNLAAATSQYRTDRWAVFVLVPLALIVVFGVFTAWWIVCQQKGMCPALDFPSWNTGGTFKAYCKP